MRPGMIPILHSPGVMIPGQLGPIMRTAVPAPFFSKRNSFTRSMSFVGIPSVMQTTTATPASAASTIASAAKGGGTKIIVALAAVAATAAGTDRNDRNAGQLGERLGDPQAQVAPGRNEQERRRADDERSRARAPDPMRFFARLVPHCGPARPGEEKRHDEEENDQGGPPPEKPRVRRERRPSLPRREEEPDEDRREEEAEGLQGVACDVPHCAAPTALRAASARPSAGVTARPDSRRIRFPSSTLVPSRRTTTGRDSPISRTAATTPFAMTSHRMMPPKLLIRIARTFRSERMIRNAFFTCSSLAPPPTSRKFAGSPPASFTRSIVAIARPAPLTMHPTFPSSLT